jgi:hypothetical protein
MAPRSTPYDIAFGADAEARFARIRESLASTGRDAHDQDAFVLDREVVTYLRELIPDEGVGEGMEQHVALLHHAYLYWAEGGWLIRPSKGRASALLTAAAQPEEPAPSGRPGPRAFYLQLPERLVWAELAPGEPHQPLDGLFVRPWPRGGYFLLAVFGLHPGREGFSVVDADGYRADELARPDGSALFAPVLPGGAAAGLFSIVGGEELLELAARSTALVPEVVTCAGPGHRPHVAVELS